ncbi:MAG: hypothetical protein NT166_25550 [Candidatus Aminicenantes bacterium]|nr:hypothetical protein [Candidatus Aminicenantes bacterium]
MADDMEITRQIEKQIREKLNFSLDNMGQVDGLNLYSNGIIKSLTSSP